MLDCHSDYERTVEAECRKKNHDSVSLVLSPCT